MCQMKYKVTRRRGMKNIRMRVQEDGTILVSAPYGVSNDLIKEALRESSATLKQGQKSMDESHARWEKLVREKFASKKVPREDIRRAGDNFVAGTPYEKGSVINGFPLVTDLQTFQRMFDAAYKNFCRLHPVALRKVTMREMKTRWGSCRPSTGRISLNLLLLYVPKNCADYVIYHELCHFLELNHSGRFWAQVEKYVPDYLDRERELRTYGEILINHHVS